MPHQARVLSRAHARRCGETASGRLIAQIRAVAGTRPTDLAGVLGSWVLSVLSVLSGAPRQGISESAARRAVCTLAPFVRERCPPRASLPMAGRYSLRRLTGRFVACMARRGHFHAVAGRLIGRLQPCIGLDDARRPWTPRCTKRGVRDLGEIHGMEEVRGSNPLSSTYGF
jgi:hypothetical protein